VRWQGVSVSIRFVETAILLKLELKSAQQWWNLADFMKEWVKLCFIAHEWSAWAEY